VATCENGWSTRPGRSETRRADVLEAVVRAVHARAEELNVTHRELLTLRDADSSKDDLLAVIGWGLASRRTRLAASVLM